MQPVPGWDLRDGIRSACHHAKTRGAIDAGTLDAVVAHPAALRFTPRLDVARIWAVGWFGARRGPEAMDPPCILSELQGHAGAMDSALCSLCRAGTYLTGAGMHRR